MTSERMAFHDLLDAIRELDERTRIESDQVRSEALAFVGGTLQSVTTRGVWPGHVAVIVRAWRPTDQ